MHPTRFPSKLVCLLAIPLVVAPSCGGGDERANDDRAGGDSADDDTANDDSADDGAADDDSANDDSADDDSAGDDSADDDDADDNPADDDVTSPCGTLACLNGGGCVVTGDTATCVCPEGFMGTVCQIATEPVSCSGESGTECLNGGLCGIYGLDELVRFCDCTPFFTGDLCETEVAEPSADGTNPIEFYYRWQADDTAPGLEEMPVPVPAPVVDLLGGSETLPATSAALRLFDDFSVVLVDTDLAWDGASATALLKTLQRFPTPPAVPADSYYRVARTSAALAHDLDLAPLPAATPWTWDVTFSDDAFTFANPIEQPPHDGVVREFYSNRLYQASLRAFFHTVDSLEQLLVERFGISVVLGEPRSDFRFFYYDELIYILSVMEDYPSGFRHLPNLRFMTRRQNGLVNPVYPLAPAIAWVSLQTIEFMDSAFSSESADYIHRLVAHELSHFVYALFDEATLTQWLALSGWAEAAPDVWVPTTTSNFVSAYAHDINPNEDFAESLSYYIYDPDWVRTVAPTKYEFLHGVVDGYEYLLVLDDAVVFDVFNLYPDRTFPGRIVRVTNIVSLMDDGSHRAVLELRVHQPELASVYAYTRLFSPSGHSYRDSYFYPVDGDHQHLRGEVTFGAYDEDGYWLAPNITVREANGGSTYLGQHDFGWMLWFDNEDPDLNPPLPDLTRVESSYDKIGEEFFVFVTMPMSDEHPEALTSSAQLNHYATGQRIENWGTWYPGDGLMEWVFVVRPYHAGGRWTFRSFLAVDGAGNSRWYDLVPTVPAIEHVLSTLTPDTTAPELDLDSVAAEAVPVHPQAPDGETDAFLHYRVRDDISGLGTVAFRLVKPSGATLQDYHYHDNFYTAYFVGDPNAWADYAIHVHLPAGSEPGAWGFMELTLFDKAGNGVNHSFSEVGILVPVE